MIRKLTNNLPEYDLCIIGAGPAGLTVAAELAYSGLKICVLESGTDRKSEFADKLKEAQSDKFKIKDNSRERVVGGSSSTWNGLSAPFDPIDFEPRPWNDGWPLTAGELGLYLKRTAVYRFPALSEFARLQKLPGEPVLPGLEEKMFIMPMPTYRFAVLRPLFEREGTDLVIDATVTKLQGSGNNGSVTHAVCKSSTGAESRVSASRFVLALGGIENPRLLLNSNLGNESDQVGRNFMNHPKSYQGYLALKRLLPARSLLLPQTDGPRMRYVGLRLSEEYQRTHELLNSYVGFEPDFGRLQRYAFKIWRRLPVLSTFFMRTLARPRSIRCRWFADMEPRAENRIILSDKADAFGMPLARVSYEMGERDKETLRALWRELSTAVELSGLGTLRGAAERVVEGTTFDASHHIGATRMGRDPKSSVVDANCRVHSLQNVYVAGSSVFPSAGCANPTMVISALAIRLADHLRGAAPPAAPLPAGGKKIIIVGGGRRVREDVVPVLEFLEPLFSITGIYTREPGSVFGRKRRYDTLPLGTLLGQQAREADYVYLAVPPREIKKALAALPPEIFGAELILDTPAPLSGRTGHMLKKFKKVHIAEDSAYLPWLDKARDAKPREIICDQSVFRYHGIALLKALCGSAGSPAKVRRGLNKNGVITLRIGDAFTRVTGARDYTKGKLFIDGKEPPMPTLTAEELSLVGGVQPEDTIVSKMLQLKRIGLARMLKIIAEGGEPWPLAEGQNDSRVDQLLHRYRFYFSLW